MASDFWGVYGASLFLLGKEQRRMKNSNAELARFCIGKVGTPYVMGTNGKIFTKSMYQDLVKRNPGEWFTTKRKPVIKTWVGQVTTDCHGLIEWFVREQSGEKYDTTANGAFLAATEKGEIKNIPELIGVCVRYPGHVGIYIGGGYVVEAKGFDYGVCLTALKSHPWTHWYKHPRIKYSSKVMLTPSPQKIGKTTDIYSVVWLQLALNRQITEGIIQGKPLVVDGVYGIKTAMMAAIYWRNKGWTRKTEVWGVGKNTIKALNNK